MQRISISRWDGSTRIPLETMQLLFNGIILALTQLGVSMSYDSGGIASWIEAITAKPSRHDYDNGFTLMSMKIIYSLPMKYDQSTGPKKLEIPFCIALETPEQIKDEIIKKMHEGLESHCTVLDNTAQHWRSKLPKPQK